MNHGFSFTTQNLALVEEAWTQQPSLKNVSAFFYEETTSTMDLARAFAQGERSVRSLLEIKSSSHSPIVSHTACTQTAGRGRESRVWVSEQGLGIYTTLAVPWSQELSSLSGLSLVAGIGIVRSLREYSDHIGLKWPNDVIVVDTNSNRIQKLAGVLIESIQSEAGKFVLIGFGVNLFPHQVYHEIQSISLSELTKATVSYPEVFVGIHAQLALLLTQFAESRFTPFVEEWEKYSLQTGRSVSFRKEGRRLDGIVLGVEKDGALRVKPSELSSQVLGSDTVNLYSGDVEFL